MKTIVAYEYKGEDYTAELVAKQGLFWTVRDADGVEKKIPAKAVTDTWEEAEDEPTPDTEPVPADAEPEPMAAEPEEQSTQAPLPSLAEQAADGPKLAPPGDTITLAALCDDQGVEPRIARRKLREAVKAGNPLVAGHNPSEGWVFNRADMDDVMAILTSRKRG